METLEPHQSPMAQFNYDATYEHHETHLEPLEPETSETFMDWYHEMSLRLTATNDTLRLHLLKECYYKTIEYHIYMTTCGYDISDHQLILQCCHLIKSYQNAII